MIEASIEAIRAAVLAGDYEAAHVLMARHEAELRAALETEPAPAEGCRQSWLELLGAQRRLLEELRTARDEAGRELDRIARERRGAAAYLATDG